MLAELFAIVTGFPTVLYTGALFLACAYWLMVMVGAVDLDSLGGAHAAMDGALDQTMDGALDGLAEGAGKAAGEGIAEAAESAGGVLAFLGLLGLRKAPFTVVLSFWSLFAWMICAWTMSIIGNWGDSFIIQFLVGIGVFFFSLFLSMPLTALTIRPLGRIFEDNHAPMQSHLIGKSCRLDTGSVNQSFGQAIVEDGKGDTYNIQVRCRKENSIKRGDSLLIISVDPKANTYAVVSMDTVSGHEGNTSLKSHQTQRQKKAGASQISKH